MSPTATVASARRAALGSFVGTTVEWYDFFLYGTAAALLFPRLFFPEFDPLVGTLLAFATFGVAFVARPVGGIIFGHFGDKVGRKPMLVTTLLIMGISTGMIGLMPTYDTIGVAAPIILVLLRVFQGLSVGGEYGGAVLMATEHAEEGRKGFYGGWVQMGSPAGLILSNAAFLLVTQLPENQLYSWGWRVPFLLSFVLVFVGLYIRLKLEESPEFRAVQLRDQISRAPIVSVVRQHYRQILLIAGAYVGTGVVVYAAAVFSLSYGSSDRVGFSGSQMIVLVMLGQIVAFFGMGAFAALADRVGIRKVFIGGNIGMALLAFPWLWLLGTGDFWVALLGYVVLFVPYSAAYGSMAAFFASIFEARLNYSGLSLGYQLGTVAGPAFAPIIATQLLASTGTVNSVAWYLIGSCAVSLICTVLLVETKARTEEGLVDAHGGVDAAREASRGIE